MDLVMPGMNGAEATRRIMASTPCAILIVTVSLRDNAGLVLNALTHGAIDAVDIPTIDGDLRNGAGAFLTKIDTMSRLIGEWPGTGNPTARPRDRVPALPACRSADRDRRIRRRPSCSVDDPAWPSERVSCRNCRRSTRGEAVRLRHGGLVGPGFGPSRSGG
jgi:chemotaxis response regulator CheB